MKKYITYEEPFAGNTLTSSQMKDVYVVMVDKTEYQNFKCWLMDMLRSGVFIEL